MGVCVRAKMVVTFAGIVLTRVHVNIHSAVRYRPFVVKNCLSCAECLQHMLKYVFRNTEINVTKLPLCNISSLTRR